MENPKSKLLLATAGAGLTAFGGIAAAQQTIIQDIFTSGSQYGVQLGALTGVSSGLEVCPTNLPGGNWQHLTGAFFGSMEFTGSMHGVNGGDRTASTGFVGFRHSSAVGIPLGAYNTGCLHFSSSVGFVLTGSASLSDTDSYILVGFGPHVNPGANYGPSALTNYTGLAVVGPSGALQDYVNGTPVGDPIPFQGAYSPFSSTLLSYTIDTATGAISDVSFSGSKANYSFPVPKSFSHSYTNAVEIGGSTGGNNWATLSSFLLRSTGPASIGSAPAASPGAVARQ
jgi:hypothetical protein